MKRPFVKILLVWCLSAALFGAEERIVWDFRSASGQIGGGKVLPKSKITARGLMAKTSNRRRDCGFQTAPGTVKAPEGAFRVTVNFIPDDAAFVPYNFHEMVLFDTMGVFYPSALAKPQYAKEPIVGFQLNLRETGKNVYMPVVNLGYGSCIARIDGVPLTLPPGKPATAGFEFDGLSVCRIFVNGEFNALSTVYAPPLPGHDACIGGNRRHNDDGFTGIVTSAAIEYLPKPDFALAVVANRTFSRNRQAALKLAFRPGDPADEFKELKLTGSFAGTAVPETAFEAGKVFKLPIETDLRPGSYQLELRLTGLRNGQKFSRAHEETLAIAPLPSDEMPVLLWNGRQPAVFAPFLKLGFNRNMFMLTEALPYDRQDPSAVASRIARLDRYAAAGMPVMDDLDFTNYRLIDAIITPNPIRDRGGKARPAKGPVADPTAPQVVSTMRTIADTAGKLYANHPAVFGTLLNTERRDRMLPQLDANANARYRQASGSDIPAEAEYKTARSYLELAGIPPSRIVPDDHPLLKYYKWYWRGGDGYHALNAAMDKAYKTGAGRNDLVTMFDPAVRVPPIWGGGGSVDLINQWVYAYPEPFRVAAVAGEMRAMAGEREGQKVAIMTQMIVKRFELCPSGVRVLRTPAWTKQEPTAPYMTTPPGLLREATWAMLARQVDYIMYHGSGALRPPLRGFEAYKYIDPESEKVLGDLLNNVVKPLGPMLRRLPERPKDTAIYESFASCIFAGRGGWGWGREWPTGMLMYRANLAPATLYIDHLERGALNDIKVLFMPHCDVICASAAKEIRKFQSRGGIVVADEHLAAGITPDIVIPEIAFNRNIGAKKFNAEYKQAAALLRKKLAPHYRPFATADPEFLTFPRKYKDADYLFVINDKRTYGDNFGVWRQVMEKGLPHAGKVAANRPAAAVYELSRGGKVDFESSSGTTSVKLDFATNDGRLLLFLDSPIERIELDVPETAAPGNAFTVTAKVFDASGKTVPALLPAELVVTAPDGRKLDGSGFECAVDGVLKKECRLALNDPSGVWNVRFTDRASGLSKTAQFTVKERNR